MCCFFFETWNLNARVTHVTFCLHSQTLDCSEDCVQVQMDLSVLNLIPVSCKIVLAPPYIYFGAGRKEAHIKEYSGWCGPSCPGPAHRAIICLRGYNTAAVALLLSITCIITSSYHHLIITHLICFVLLVRGGAGGHPGDLSLCVCNRQNIEIMRCGGVLTKSWWWLISW